MLELEVNRRDTPRSTSSSQRSVPPGLSRDATTRRPSGDRRNVLVYSPGSPTTPCGFPVRSSQLNWLTALEALYSSIPPAETATFILPRSPILATGSAIG